MRYRGKYFADEDEAREYMIQEKRERAELCVEDMLRIGGLLPPLKSSLPPPKSSGQSKAPTIPCEQCGEKYTPIRLIRVEDRENSEGQPWDKVWIYSCPHCLSENEL